MEPQKKAWSNPPPDDLQDLFTQLDTNGDGVLSPQEMAAMQVRRDLEWNWNGKQELMKLDFFVT